MPLVASRLMSVKNVEIVSINDAPIHSCGALEQKGKYAVVDEDGDLVDLREFFFLEARGTSSNDGGGQHSALDLLAKQYNNTKWKGCNLRVECARPHFLKRLEIERAERKARELAEDVSAVENDESEHKAQEDTSDTMPTDEQAAKENPNVRRRLRIKKRFGEEAYHVDAHPQTLYITDDSEWSKFASLHRRMKDKFASQRMKLVERRQAERKSWMMKGSKDGKEPNDRRDDLRGLMFLNRGIHIRFGSGGDDDKHLSSSDDSMDEIENEAKEAYVWSDAESIEDKSKFAAAADAGGGNGLGSVGSRSESDSEVSTEDEVVDDHTKNVSGYIWSDDESEDMSKSKKNSEFRTTNTLDEFSGGLDFDDDISNSTYKSDDEENEATSQYDDDVSVKLEDDIRSNLGILSKLFPGESVSNTPLNVAAVDAASAHDCSEKSKPSSAFGAGLIVQRYDPTKEDTTESMRSSVTQDLNKNTDEHADSGNDSKSEADEISSESSENQSVMFNEQVDKTSDNDSESNEGNNADAAEIKTTEQSDFRQAPQDDTGNEVYEQDKLESIFKQAREQQQNTGFSFGAMFDNQLGGVADSQTDLTSENTGGTGFSFGFSDVAREPMDTSSEQPEPSKPIDSDNVIEQAPKEHRRKSRVGLRFPTSVLDEYEALFFSLNEGPQIIADMESMRNNEEIQERWQKKREVLTSDWKRKQKNALSRKVKKVKRY